MYPRLRDQWDPCTLKLVLYKDQLKILWADLSDNRLNKGALGIRGAWPLPTALPTDSWTLSPGHLILTSPPQPAADLCPRPPGNSQNEILLIFRQPSAWSWKVHTKGYYSTNMGLGDNLEKLPSPIIDLSEWFFSAWGCKPTSVVFHRD